MRLRHARPADEELLGGFLLLAAFWRADAVRPPLTRALEDVNFARYVAGFGRDGDFGVIAERDARALGAAWWRLFPADSPGYGFVDEATPELSIAVVPDARGEGIGTALLEALQHEARAQRVIRISLSVERENRALALYERRGFRVLHDTRGALTMAFERSPTAAAPDDGQPRRVGAQRR